MTTHEDLLAEANEAVARAMDNLDSAITESIFENGQLDIKNTEIEVTADGRLIGKVNVEGEALPLHGAINTTANEWSVTIGSHTVNFDAADISYELDEIDTAQCELKAVVDGDYPDGSYCTDECEDDND